ncbi:cytochrome c [bacterium]|nr:MAG: cytochrome c [bacterium]
MRGTAFHRFNRDSDERGVPAVNKLMTAAAMLALAGLVVTGCSKGAQSSSTSSETSAAASPAAEASAAAAASPAAVAAAGAGDVDNGKKVYGANCASCHGADGSGGVGPSLHGDLKTPTMPRTQAALVAWIKDPKPPMPKLYPSTLNEKDVADVAAYVLASFK